MHKSGHTLVGVGLAIGLAAFEPTFFAKVSVAVGALAGTSAPDWLEISRSKKVGGQWVRQSVIPHRTLTHWVPPWVALVGYAVYQDLPLLLGFATAGLLHLLTDLPNPMGVPVVYPWKRVSLRWWESGRMDWLLGMGAIFCGVACWL